MSDIEVFAYITSDLRGRSPSVVSVEVVKATTKTVRVRWRCHPIADWDTFVLDRLALARGEVIRRVVYCTAFGQAPIEVSLTFTASRQAAEALRYITTDMAANADKVERDLLGVIEQVRAIAQLRATLPNAARIAELATELAGLAELQRAASRPLLTNDN